MKKFWSENRFVVSTFLLWRVYLFLLAYIASLLLPFKYSFPYAQERLISSGLPDFFWSFGNFDGVHYLDIAKDGYHAGGTQVFFPLYPIILKLLSYFFNGSLVIAGLVVSNFSALVFLLLTYRIVCKKWDSKTAKWTILFILMFPTSFFLGSIYTESFFLMLLILSFSDSNFSFLSNILASGTRLVGIFVSTALFLTKKNILWLFSLSGFLAYVIYLYIKFGNALYFLTGQSAFKNGRADSLSTLVNPVQVLYRYLKILTTVSMYDYSFWIAFLELASFIFAIMVLLKISFKKNMPKEWLYYSWPALVLPTLSGTLSSMPRYLVVIFPIYIYLATIKNGYVRISMLLLSSILLSVLTILFTRGYWVS